MNVDDLRFDCIRYDQTFSVCVCLKAMVRWDDGSGKPWLPQTYHLGFNSQPYPKKGAFMWFGERHVIGFTTLQIWYDMFDHFLPSNMGTNLYTWNAGTFSSTYGIYNDINRNILCYDRWSSTIKLHLITSYNMLQIVNLFHWPAHCCKKAHKQK